MTKKTTLFANFKADFSSGLVVFLVALPLCLGIALASNAPPLSGIIAGIVGGIVVGIISRSHISVSGPAAGLTAIVFKGITDLGAFELFLTAGMVAGTIQLILGFIKAGSISNYFPANVIEGMLAGIGIIIILKQIPHAVGYDSNFEGDETFLENRGGNTFESILYSVDNVQAGAVIITLVSLSILILWNKIDFLKRLKLVPGALVAVVIGVALNEIFLSSGSSLAIQKEHLVRLPVPKNWEEFKNVIIMPDIKGLADIKVWTLGATIAIVASIETLLCIEASDRMDLQKRYTDTNVELKAQGIGNILSSLIGGLPMTSVVVRSSANAAAGAKSKMSAIIHGILLLASVLSVPFILNKIPLATLAAVLLLVGYKLARPAVILHFWHKGKYQFVPFIATLLAVVFTDLLKGVALGIVISILFLLKGNLKRAFRLEKEKLKDGDIIIIDLAQEVSFLNKAAIKAALAEIPENSRVAINASDTVYIAHDVLDLIHEFATIRAAEENIKVILKGFKKAYALGDIEKNSSHIFFEDYEESQIKRAGRA
ncbi:MAG TPA: SulP family inorganic anion transporter [Flavobacterium sp.]|nr:SulP family inorganic anion transporter [Flavobacterium sp.]